MFNIIRQHSTAPGSKPLPTMGWKLLAISRQLFSTQTGALLLRPTDPYFLASGFPKFIDICSEAPALFWLVAKNSPNFKKPTFNYYQTMSW